MLNKFILTTLLILVGNLAVAPYIYASGNSEEDVKFAKKVKTEIVKLGIGKDARIKVKLKDGTKLKGYVSEINDDNFVVKNEKTKSSTTVLYSSAKQIRGNNLSTEVIVIIGFVALIVIVLIGIGYSS